MLDVCSYVGGWASLPRSGSGAPSATCVDSSETALDAMLRRNAARNGLQVTTLARGDAFDVLEAPARRKGGSFDVPHRGSAGLHQAHARICRKGEAAYRKLNQLAMKLAGRRRIAGELLLLLAFACREPPGVAAVCGEAGRLRACSSSRQGGQSPDHPVHPAMPETRYLKALFAPRLPVRIRRMLTYPRHQSRSPCISARPDPLVRNHVRHRFRRGLVAGRGARQRPGSTWNAEQVDDLIFWVMVGVILGGRIGYVLLSTVALQMDLLAATTGCTR